MTKLNFSIRPFTLLPLLAASVFAQGVTPEMLLKPPADTWPGYHGDYSGKRHSPLTQITPANVGSLSLAWAFQTGAATQIKASPLVVDGVIYFSVPDVVCAHTVDPVPTTEATPVARPVGVPGVLRLEVVPFPS